MPSPELTRRRLLGAAVATGLAGAGAGAGTMAAFSDSESSTSNSVQSGTLDLTLDGGDSTVTFLSEVDIAPGESGTATLTVANAGSISGYLDVEVASVTTYENGCVGNESSADDSCGDPGQGLGELQDHLQVQAEFQNGPQLWSTYDTVANRLSEGTVYDLDYELPGGGSDTFVLNWQFPDNPGEEAQSDGIEFALTFSLDQRTDTGA
jgi:predicted ribosomally synthesized peptide with SipW-like signal peptide